MRTLARWSPFRELAPFASVPETFFTEFPFAPVGTFESMPAMRMDVMEDDGGYVVKADIPGMKKEDIAVSIDGNTVSITAKATTESEVKEGERVLRTERYRGSLSRVITLPFDVDPAKAEAAYDAGVLTMRLPKAPGVEARQLVVH